MIRYTFHTGWSQAVTHEQGAGFLLRTSHVHIRFEACEGSFSRFPFPSQDWLSCPPPLHDRCRITGLLYLPVNTLCEDSFKEREVVHFCVADFSASQQEQNRRLFISRGRYSDSISDAMLLLPPVPQLRRRTYDSFTLGNGRLSNTCIPDMPLIYLRFSCPYF